MSKVLPTEYQDLTSRDRRKIRRLLDRFEAIPKRCSKPERALRDRLKLQIAVFRRSHGIGIGPVPAIDSTTSPSDSGGTR